MAKKIVWKTGTVVSIKLRDDLYTLAQLLTNPVMRFYRIKSPDGKWQGVDLNNVPSLFAIFVGKVVLQNLAVEALGSDLVIPSREPENSLWIKPSLNFAGGFAFKGGNLIDTGSNRIGTSVAPVVKANLSLEQDRKIVEEHELTNMWGDKDLAERLIRFFESGTDRDEMKSKIFPGL